MYSSCKRQHILHYAGIGHKSPTICHLLLEEGLQTSRIGIHKFLPKYNETRSIERRPGSGRPTKMTETVRALVEQQMKNDDERTAIRLHALLQRHSYTMTLKTILRSCYSGVDVQRQSVSMCHWHTSCCMKYVTYS